MDDSSVPDISTKDIEAKIKGNIGKKILFYRTVGSTNTIAADIAEKDDEGTVIIADSQECGRGRLGRTWVSPPNTNIYMSIITRPRIDSQNVTLITIMTAFACANALRRSTGLDVGIKWPNDLVVKEKKLGGILTELKIENKKLLFAVIGIGINVNIDLDTFPDEVRDIATSLKNETGKIFSRTDIIADILNEMDTWYETLQSMKCDEILDMWKKLEKMLGKQVIVTAGEEVFKGIAESIDDRGFLILRLPSGDIKRIKSGDLKILREEELL